MASARLITRRNALASTAAAACLGLFGCVDQHPERAGADAANADIEAAERVKQAELATYAGTGSAQAATSQEDDAAALAQAREDATIVATSAAVVDVCDRLDLDLVGIPQTSADLPKRYEGLETVGTPMSPDMEILASIRPDYVLSPSSLREDLEPKYQAVGLGYYFVDLSSLDGMYSSIEQLGSAFDREDEAEDQVEEYDAYLKKLDKRVKGFDPPAVLLLMGVPGSYLVASEQSYVGSLVAQAGGKNVYAEAEDDFVNANVEDMLARDPDVILRCAHGVPDDVLKMFAEEFSTNSIWQHFRAVQEGDVYDLSYDLFGMSATFDYPDAFDELIGYLYGQGA